jgi:hypothetical protein
MKRVAAWGLYGLFLLLCAELALQVFYRETAGQWLWTRVSTPIYQADAHAGVWNRANLDYTHHTNEFSARYVTNAAGLRVAQPGREFATPKPEGVFRVMLIGASFAYGWGVDYEQTLAAQLEQRLRASGFAGERRIELVNVGVPSLPEADQIAWYRAEGARYAPDLVIQLMYGSLVIPVTQARLHVDAAGYLSRPDTTPADEVSAVLKKSGLVFYGWILSLRLAPSGEVAGAGRAQAQAAAFRADAPEVVHTVEHFTALRGAIAEHGGRLVVAYFPLSYVVHPQDEARWRHLGVTDVAAQIAFDDAMCRALLSRGFECVNGTPALLDAARASDERLYYRLDIHWTARGNEVAAARVAEYLLSSAR